MICNKRFVGDTVEEVLGALIFTNTFFDNGGDVCFIRDDRVFWIGRVGITKMPLSGE